MTPKPTNYEKLKEKLIYPLLVIGVAAIIGMLWAVKVDVEIIKEKENQASKTDQVRTELVQQALDMSKKNNIILNTKADESTNEFAHKQIIVQLDDVSEQLHKVIMRIYGVVNKPDTTYLMPLLDSVICTAKLPIIIKHKKKHNGNI